MSLKELKVIDHEKMKMFVDNKSTIYLVNHQMIHGRSKHIERRYHFLKVQLTDILTKSLKKTRFDVLKGLIGMRSLGCVDQVL